MDAGVHGSRVDAVTKLGMLFNTVLKTEGNVFLQRVGEQEVILRNIGDIPVQDSKGNFADRYSVQKQHSLFAVVDSEQQVCKGGLSTSRASENTQHLSLTDVQVDVFQHRRVAVRVGKGEILHLNITL